MRGKGVTANNENRKELCLKVKMEVPNDAAEPLMGLNPKKTRIGKAQTGKRALQHYLQSQDMEAT